MGAMGAIEAEAARQMADPETGHADLAELISAFNEVTARLTESHEMLRGEVSRLQGELREANELVERSRRLAALGEMAAGIAHEVRNPLASIGLYAEMLRSDLPEDSPEREVATRIGTSVRDLDAVVGDVLAFAREIRPRLAPVETEALLRRAAEACAGLAEEQGVAIEIRVPAGAAGELMCDCSLAQQALVNLVRNGAQAAAEAGEVGRLVIVSAHAIGAGAEIALRVEDTGPGVPAEAIERMFNPFFTTRATGSGLGLAIVHRIVDAHGGRVTVQNKPEGAGAIVEIRLPRRGGAP